MGKRPQLIPEHEFIQGNGGRKEKALQVFAAHRKQMLCHLNRLDALGNDMLAQSVREPDH